MTNNKVRKTIIKEVFSQHKKKNLLAIILFGSRARGDFREDSDYDICVYLKNKEINFTKSFSELNYNGYPITITFIDKKNFNHLYEKRHPHLYCTFRDGLAIYQKDEWFDKLKPEIINFKPSKKTSFNYICSSRNIFKFTIDKNIYDYEETKKAANLLGFGIMMFHGKYPLSPHNLSQELKQYNENYKDLVRHIQHIQNRHYKNEKVGNEKHEKYFESLKYLYEFATNFLEINYPNKNLKTFKS